MLDKPRMVRKGGQEAPPASLVRPDGECQRRLLTQFAALETRYGNHYPYYFRTQRRRLMGMHEEHGSSYRATVTIMGLRLRKLSYGYLYTIVGERPRHRIYRTPLLLPLFLNIPPRFAQPPDHLLSPACSHGKLISAMGKAIQFPRGRRKRHVGIYWRERYQERANARRQGRGGGHSVLHTARSWTESKKTLSYLGERRMNSKRS